MFTCKCGNMSISPTCLACQMEKRGIFFIGVDLKGKKRLTDKLHVIASDNNMSMREAIQSLVQEELNKIEEKLAV